MDRPVALPQGYRGSVLIQDVVEFVAQLGPGGYDPADLHDRYMAFVSAKGRVGGNTYAFGQVLSELGHRKVNVWRIAG